MRYLVNLKEVIFMKLKPILKTLWISLLSTLILVLSQSLTEKGFQDINTIRLAFIQVPIEYFIINFFIFVLLTILFIKINDLLPVHKLAKGIFYAGMVSLIWTALRFQPLIFEDFERYLYDSFVFIIPMIIYGVFLGYLASNKSNSIKFEKGQLTHLIISVVWILFHIVYMLIFGSAKGQVFYYILWLITTSLIIAVVFGLVYEISYAKNKNTFINVSLAVIVVFITYYSYRFAIKGQFEMKFLIRVLLDFISIMLAVQIIELYFNRFQEIEEDKKQAD